jgi:hypothetical protein
VWEEPDTCVIYRLHATAHDRDERALNGLSNGHLPVPTQQHEAR